MKLWTKMRVSVCFHITDVKTHQAIQILGLSLHTISAILLHTFRRSSKYSIVIVRLEDPICTCAFEFTKEKN